MMDNDDKNCVQDSFYVKAHMSEFMWCTYSACRGLYFYDVTATVYPFPLKTDEVLALVPHLIHTVK